MSTAEIHSSKRDLSTNANYEDIVSKHLALNWTVNWEDKLISGSVEHTLIALKEDVKTVVLDSSYLAITEVSLEGATLEFSVGKRDPVKGSALSIDLPYKLKAGQSVKVKIAYSTTSGCTALGWLEPEQTKGGKFPYFYSQSQAIAGRSLIPCQDTPSVKSTYSSAVKSTLPVLMSALRVSPPTDSKTPMGEEAVYVYNQPVAIPSYLIAIASGSLVYKQFDSLPGKNWTTGVWTEPEAMDAVFWEFKEDTANFVKVAEELASPYQFGVYDVLLLPPSFPYGGMENACLTFATPTLIAGDRSSVDVVAHEISHSWFGNGIGCATWGHFWLNEGFTTYLERLIQNSIYGSAERGLSYVIGSKALDTSVAEFESQGGNYLKYTRMVIPYSEGDDPDDAFSSIPYEKGANLLLYLETQLGGLDVFLPYIKSYIATFSGKSISTTDFKEHLYSFFNDKKDILDKVDWSGWLDGEGGLPLEMKYDTSLADGAYALAAKWVHASSNPAELVSFSPADIATFKTPQLIVFLEKLDGAGLSKEASSRLGEIYSLSSNGNAEIRSRFYYITLGSGSDEFAEGAADWVSTQGRMKFCRPTYRALFKVAPELARSTFKSHKGFYHPIASGMIAKDLGLV